MVSNSRFVINRSGGHCTFWIALWLSGIASTPPISNTFLRAFKVMLMLKIQDDCTYSICII